MNHQVWIPLSSRPAQKVHRCLLVIRNGLIVGEEYYNGYDKSRPHNVMSVSKSFMSALTGIALHQGYIDSLGEGVLTHFPEYIYTGIDPRKHDITVGIC